MIETVPATLDLLRAVPGNEAGESLLRRALAGEAYVVLDDGRPVAAGGVWDQDGGRACAWAVIGTGITPRQLLACTRIADRMLADMPFDRIDTPVHATFAAGIRWAELLGFQIEGVMTKYHEGEDYFLYART
ncbi:MAG TPA: hypothetical protein VKA19_07710 [Alphaproteobacteria bacterium]|nr:hypothetical protein [Alphaproteobacteria bacterium]